ncbi:MAG: 16S rRNA (cytosine(1402)-N(4))-methyltransferase RsmH [Flavobacteriaceae bacterium]|nr:16S rRNA (cytosine(1402)-N(4))-methyltransferase RsmH [Flavobacteriaceae bacterium]MDG1912692.1 16S rRNA (cytosine(1402)-N(4))-methyltransferase RsmH [Flavobacteriaceae bacterium]
MRTQYHNPVLLQASIEGLYIRPGGTYADVTFGGGGHSRAILEELNEEGRLLGFDQDADALRNSIEDSRFDFVAANFSHLSQYLKYHKIDKLDGILADFGVSSHQFDTQERGFSIRTDARLDMRMNQAQSLDAQEVINTYSEKSLASLFFEFGELKNSKSMAKRIVSAREEKDIVTTMDLIELIRPLVPQRIENKILAQLFQALRIEVNNELEVLKSFLVQATETLCKGGRLVCISYHSLEDRLVKRFIQTGSFDGELEKDFYGNPIKPLSKIGKLIIPSPEEIKDNGRARSAKLRIAEKI